MSENEEYRSYLTIDNPDSWIFVDRTLDHLADLHPDLQRHPIVGPHRGRDRKVNERIWVFEPALPFMIKCHHLGVLLEQIQPKHQQFVLNHLARRLRATDDAAISCGSWPRASFDVQRSTKLIESAISSLYECIVGAALFCAGYDVTFIPEGRTPTPDIELKGEQLLIECKDLKTESLAKQNPNTFGLALRRELDDAHRKYKSYDVSQTLDWVTFLDLPDSPEGARVARNKGSESAFLFEALFDVNEPTRIAERYFATILSCHECHSHRIRSAPESQSFLPNSGSSWRVPLGPPSSARLAGFYDRLYRSLERRRL